MSNSMIFTKDIIIKLKEVRDEKGLSLNDVLDMVEQNGGYVSKTTLSRVFAEGSEDIKFRYEDTIRPIANALLDMETIEDDDSMDTKAMKSLLKYKIQRIEELEQKVEHLEVALDKAKIKYHDKLDEERELYNRRVDFLKEQISLKDKRMDQLLEAVFTKDQQHKEMLTKLLKCSKCEKYEN